MTGRVGNKGVCRRGHPLVGDNVLNVSKGRTCRICYAAGRKAYYEANKPHLLLKQKERYAKNRDRYNAYKQEWQRLNPEKRFMSNRRWWLKKRYGIVSFEQYDKMLADQAGLCAICGRPETTVHQSGTPMSLHVDHCHVSGKIRKLLCGKCNKALGLFADDPTLIRQAAAYLEAHRA